MLQKRIDDQPTISRQMVREAEAVFHHHLKKVGLKRTGQRDTILRMFLETRDHLSTDELSRLVKKKDQHIGFTTVYRTLKLLVECGLASEVAFNDGIARYEHQYQRRNHHHMVCTECGSSVEFFSADIERIEQEVGRKNKYLTTRHTFQIYGVCEKCQKQQKRA
ncbi:MAG: Fur family transcriptional regulator [Candidatus Korobacteraceae bacterium]|jgi:Fur family transcriptional regulator, ferric uptake regulator